MVVTLIIIQLEVSDIGKVCNVSRFKSFFLADTRVS